MFNYLEDNISSDCDRSESRNNKVNSFKNILIESPALLSGMSHEMRTHMNAIVAFSFIMQDNSCSSIEREEFGKQIIKSCEQLMLLFDSFLDTAILDTLKAETGITAFKPQELINELLPSMRDTIEKAEHQNIEFITEIQACEPNLFWNDNNKVSRILLSLFHNSLRSTDAGYIKIGFNYSDENFNFYVTDSGKSYFKNRELFYSKNLNESLEIFNDTYTALNIALVKKLIQMLDGTIRIECNGLTGTSVFFSIPAKVMLINKTEKTHFKKLMTI